MSDRLVWFLIGSFLTIIWACQAGWALGKLQRSMAAARALDLFGLRVLRTIPDHPAVQQAAHEAWRVYGDIMPEDAAPPHSAAMDAGEKKDG